MSKKLEDRVAIVSGAGGGIGRGLAIALGAAGARVIGVGRNFQQMQDLEAEVAAVGGQAIGCCADVRDDAAIRQMITFVESRFGPVDLLVNNAAVMYLAPMAEAEVSDWHDMVDINLKAPLTLIGAVLPGMVARRSGHIVNLSSISARKVGPGVTVYSATKTALDVVSEGLRQEVAAKGVRVTSLQLGAVATDLNDKIRNAPMRRLIKTRASTYTALSVDDAVAGIMHALCLPASVNLGSAFLVPTDQAG